MQKRKVGINITYSGNVYIFSSSSASTLTHYMPYPQNGYKNKNNFNNLPNKPLLTGSYGTNSTSYQILQDPICVIKIQYHQAWEEIQLNKNLPVCFASNAKHDSGVLGNLMIATNRLYSPDISLNDFGIREF